VPRRRGDAPIKRLADLADDDQVVYGPGLERSELLVPGRGRRTRRIAKEAAELKP